MQMQANFMMQAGDNAMNQATYDNRAEGNFMGGLIHLGQPHAEHYPDFMEGVGGPEFGGFGGDGFGFGGFGGGFAMGGPAMNGNPNANTANNSMLAGLGGDPYQQAGPFGGNFNNSMESQPFLNQHDPYAQPTN